MAAPLAARACRDCLGAEELALVGHEGAEIIAGAAFAPLTRARAQLAAQETPA